MRRVSIQSTPPRHHPATSHPSSSPPPPVLVTSAHFSYRGVNKPYSPESIWFIRYKANMFIGVFCYPAVFQSVTFLSDFARKKSAFHNILLTLFSGSDQRPVLTHRTRFSVFNIFDFKTIFLCMFTFCTRLFNQHLVS